MLKLLGFALAVMAAALLAGCQWLGPKAIDYGRPRYNSIIQATSMEQTLSNIVRVYNHEPTLFMEVTEVDAAQSFGGSLTGAATSIGAQSGNRTSSGGTITGRLGSATGTVQYSETPTIRYQPLLGQPLVAQLVTPVSIEALALLLDSSWDVSPVFDMAVSYLTLNFDLFYPALNTIAELEDNGALEIVASNSDLSDQPPVGAAAVASGTASKSTASTKDTLVIYLLPFNPHAKASDDDDKRRILQLWIRLLRIYAGTQPAFQPETAKGDACRRLGLSTDAAALKDWDVHMWDKSGKNYLRDRNALDAARACLPNSLELRTSPAPAKQARGLVTRAPVIRTLSGLGILKTTIERPKPKVEFLSPQAYAAIRAHPWNRNVEKLSFYTLLRSDEDSFNCPAERKGGCDNPAPSERQADVETHKGHADALDQWLAAAPELRNSNDPAKQALYDQKYPGDLFVYEAKGDDVLDDEHIKRNHRLGLLRRYILVIVADHLPAEPVYAAYEYGGQWYYIAADDPVSQKNFHLLSLFLTMMAVPSAMPPLSPTINVGGS